MRTHARLCVCTCDREALSRVISFVGATFRHSLLTLVESAVSARLGRVEPQIAGRDEDFVSFPRERITQIGFDTVDRLDPPFSGCNDWRVATRREQRELRACANVPFRIEIASRILSLSLSVIIAPGRNRARASRSVAFARAHGVD